MRRLSSRLLLSAAGLTLPSVAVAAPPSLPVDDDAADTAPETTGADSLDPPEDGLMQPEFPGEGLEDLPPGESTFEYDAETIGENDDDLSDDGPNNSDDPGLVRGRREAMSPIAGGGIGLFHTSLPEVGGKYTFRFRLGTDFFSKEGFFCCGNDVGNDAHSRVRGGVDLGFTVAKWGEIYFGVHSAANRNERDAAARQDPPTVFALGDMNLGFKGAHRFDNGVGLGGQIGLGMITGSERLITERVNFNIDGIFALDLRYLTDRHAPVRFSTNIGWMLDNSIKVVDWRSISDDLSREVLRFAMNANHSRVRTRYAVDFPFRVGKDRQIGIDPFIEYSWDIATHLEPAFEPLTKKYAASPLPRSQSWLTVGVRANLVDGLFIDAGVDIGTSSPNYEFGPPVPPWQAILGIGWSFDPKPVIKEIEIESEATELPMPVLDGRIVGRVTDATGTPVSGVLVDFTGLSTNSILTDSNGGFTSYRFPAGAVTIALTLADGSVVEHNAEVEANLDTQVNIELEGAMPEEEAAEGTLFGTLLDSSGAPIKDATVQVVGHGLDEPFTCCDDSGAFGVRLPVGEYTATITAPGFKSAITQFSVSAGDEGNSFTATLDADSTPETPNIKASKTRIRLKKSLRYDNDVVDPSSHPILDELATFLKYHPEYAELEIRVHTDDRGKPAKRSLARAQSVQAYLATKGIAADRLTTVGAGDKKPIAVNLTVAGRKKNNRTELRVKGYTGEK